MPQSQIVLPLRRKGGSVARLIEALKIVVLRQRERQQLARLDGHLLRDIGLDAQAAEAECTKPFWKD
jgi:uncharacterized protein YjiS (DUF1127 family)